MKVDYPPHSLRLILVPKYLKLSHNLDAGKAKVHLVEMVVEAIPMHNAYYVTA